MKNEYFDYLMEKLSEMSNDEVEAFRLCFVCLDELSETQRDRVKSHLLKYSEKKIDDIERILSKK